MRINHNIAALNAYRNLEVNNENTSKSLEKLSSGLRINRAADDAAGLAISEKMRSQIRGLDMAHRNALDGISVVQTADGALNSTQEILQRMRELAVQAANGSNTDSDRENIQAEINQLTSEVNRIGNTTEFNTGKLLDGSRLNNFNATGKGFLDGSSTYFDSNTGLTLAIQDSDSLETGIHTAKVTKALAGKANPQNIVPQDYSEIFDSYGVASNGEIGVTSAAGADDWTLTLLQKGQAAAITDNPLNNGGTGVTPSITGNGSTLSGGSHTVSVTADFVGKSFEGGVPSYNLDLTGENPLSVPSTASVSFANDSIDFVADNSSPSVSAGDAVSIEQLSDGSFQITDTNPSVTPPEVFTDTFAAGVPYQNHGLSFTLDSATGLNIGDKITFTVPASGSISTKQTGFTTDPGFTAPVTVNDNVETGNWTITKGTSNWQVKFTGVDANGNPVTHTDNINDGVSYKSHGISFDTNNMPSFTAGKSVSFTTTAADSYYDYSIDVDGTKQIVAPKVKGTGIPGSISSAYTGSFTGYNGLTLDLANLTEGQFNFTVDPAVADQFQLTNASGTKTAQMVAGQPFDNFGLQFEIGNTQTMQQGNSISFSTITPPNVYNYQLAIDDQPPVTIAENVPVGTDPIVLANSSIPGLQMNSLALKEGSFDFGIKDTGTGEDNSIHMQIGASAGQMVTLQIDDMRASALNISSATKSDNEQIVTLLGDKKTSAWYTTVDGSIEGNSNGTPEYALDVTTTEKAQAAITVYDDAVQHVSSERARLGAIQNRLEYTSDNLQTMSENVTSSESRIRDVDMALEMSNFTKNNILNQAAQAMLSQANQLPQGVLQLLK